MGKVTGFLEYEREVPTRRPIEERVNDYFEIYQEFDDSKVKTQAARCMDCGGAFLQHRLPVEQPDPRLERPGVSRPLARSGAHSARDE